MAINAEDLLEHHRFTGDQYRVMGETGIFHEDDRVELIEGEIIEMSPIGSLHAGTVNRLQTLLMQAVVARGIVSTQNPLVLGSFSEPQPDIALLRPRSDFYAEAHPTPEDVLLLVEVAESSLHYDRRVKLPLYARHRIPAVWLVDLPNERLLLFSEPMAHGYRVTETADLRHPLGLPGLPGLSLDLSGLFQ
ncbi:MAG: Uma2 family endonuclease [Candidatus Thiosymbion ectosymbiont of Robbea hypermnestra]|nr:Uma2 family endonuclease [Candidatus Thiosymbion ectosymbiont of Robbea hypermnestra]